jgi:chromosome segregation ATPase
MDSIIKTPIDNWSIDDKFVARRLDNNLGQPPPSIHCSSRPLPTRSFHHQLEDTGSSNNDLITANYHPNTINRTQNGQQQEDHHQHQADESNGTFNDLLEATQSRIVQLEGANTQLRDRLHEALNDLEAAYSLLTVLQRTQKTWERHIPDGTSLVTAAVEAERAEQETRNAQALRLLKSKDEALKRLDTRANEAESEALEFQNQLSSALKELDASQAKVQEVIESRTKLRRQMQKQEQTAVATFTSLQSQVDEVKQQLVTAEEKQVQAEKENRKLIQSLNACEEHINRLERRAEREGAELEEQQEVNEQMQYQLSAQLEMQKKLQSTVVSLQGAVEGYKERSVVSEKQQAGLVEAYSALQQEHGSLTQRLNAVKEELKVANDDKKKLEADNQQQKAIFEKEIEGLKGKETELEAQLKQYEESQHNYNALLSQCQQTAASLEASISGTTAASTTTMAASLRPVIGSSTPTATARPGDGGVKSNGEGTVETAVVVSAMAMKNSIDHLRSITTTAVEMIAERRVEHSQHAVIRNLTLKLAAVSREAAVLAAQKEELEARERLLQTFAPSSLSSLPRAAAGAVYTAVIPPPALSSAPIVPNDTANSSSSPSSSSYSPGANDREHHQRLEGLFALTTKQLNGLKALKVCHLNGSGSISSNSSYDGNGNHSNNSVEEEVATVQSTLNVIQEEMNGLMVKLGRYAEANFKWKCQEIEAAENKLKGMIEELNAKGQEVNEMQEMHAAMEAKLEEVVDALMQAEVDKQSLATQLQQEQAKYQAAVDADSKVQKQQEEQEDQQRQYAALAQKMALSMAASEAARAELEHKRLAVETLAAEVADLKADNQQAAEKEARLIEKIAVAKGAYTEVVSRLDQLEEGQSRMKESVDARLDALNTEHRQGPTPDDDDSNSGSAICVMKEGSFNALITGLDNLLADAAELDRRVGLLESQADALSQERRGLRVALEARLAKADECCNALADEVERLTLQNELELKVSVDDNNDGDVF